MYCSGCSEEAVKNVLNQKFNQTVDGWSNRKLNHVVDERSKHKPKKIASACLAGLISTSKLTKKEKEKIKKNFRINDFIEENGKLINDETVIKSKVKKWFNHLVDHLVDNLAIAIENENINENKEKGGMGEKEISEAVFVSPEKNVLQYLNEVAGRSFQIIENNLKHIRARLAEGYDQEQLKRIIEIKTTQWKDSVEFSKYLNPETLFRPRKIEKYWQEVVQAQLNPDKYKEHYEKANTGSQQSLTSINQSANDAVDRVFGK
jgi:uncharacterized phage protein (TIGR02220 family)